MMRDRRFRTNTWAFDPRRIRFFDGKPLTRLWLLEGMMMIVDTEEMGMTPNEVDHLVGRKLMETKLKLKMKKMMMMMIRRTPSTSSNCGGSQFGSQGVASAIGNKLEDPRNGRPRS